MSEPLALLLTDVVDSTQLAERLGDVAAAELSAAHDRVARDLLRAWRGREIDKTDGMLMLFEQAADALGFAVAYHAALAALPVPLRARAGLHVGAVILRSNSPEDVAHGAKPLEVEGIAKPIAARVMSLALGGQTLLTAEARAALGEHVHCACSRMASGASRASPSRVELFEAGDERAPFTPPPDSAKVYRVVRRRRPVAAAARGGATTCRRNATPSSAGTTHCSTLARRFDGGARLVSLLGVGGTGKTRLAMRFARTWLGDYPGGAWFCDLSQRADAGRASLHAVAHGPGRASGRRTTRWCSWVTRSPGVARCLVILDNFEQVTRHAARHAGALARTAAPMRASWSPRARCWACPARRCWRCRRCGPATRSSLFMQRAASARHGFEAGDAGPAAIEQLVGLLDGLPLAIELAAARVRVMSPWPRCCRAWTSVSDCSPPPADGSDRQATLRATFDWSWDLLSDAEKSALAQMSVFEGGFTLEAAEAVLDLSACGSAPWVVDVAAVAGRQVLRARCRPGALRPADQRAGLCGGASVGRRPLPRQRRGGAARRAGAARRMVRGPGSAARRRSRLRRSAQSRRGLPLGDPGIRSAECGRRVAGRLGRPQSSRTLQQRRRTRGCGVRADWSGRRGCGASPCGAGQRAGVPGAFGAGATALRDRARPRAGLGRPGLPGRPDDPAGRPGQPATAAWPRRGTG